MAFSVKNWQDGLTGGTPIDAAALKDLESRLAAYAESLSLGTRIFSQPGSAAVGASGSWRADTNGTITLVTMSVVTGPVGSDLVVDVRKNGATFTTLTMTAGTSLDVTAQPNMTYQAGDKFSVNAISVGSTTPAAGVVVQFDFKRS